MRSLVECLLEGGSAALFPTFLFEEKVQLVFCSERFRRRAKGWRYLKLLFVHIFEMNSPEGKRTAMCRCLLRRAERNVGMDWF